MLRELCSARSPLFRDILAHLKQERDSGRIAPERYLELYDYVYSCYSVNVSAAVGCNINTKFRHLPLHLDSGNGDFQEKIPPQDLGALRPTWVFNPAVLRQLSFQDIVEIRKAMTPVMNGPYIRNFYEGTTQPEDWKDTVWVWEMYTQMLESKIRNAFLEKENEQGRKIMEEFVGDQVLKCPEQITVVTPTIEIVKSLLSMIPLAGECIGAAEAVSNVGNAVVSLTKRKEREKILRDYQSIHDVVAKNTRVITCYGNGLR